jgi:hypothetical protein
MAIFEHTRIDVGLQIPFSREVHYDDERFTMELFMLTTDRLQKGLWRLITRNRSSVPKLFKWVEPLHCNRISSIISILDREEYPSSSVESIVRADSTNSF